MFWFFLGGGVLVDGLIVSQKVVKLENFASSTYLLMYDIPTWKRYIHVWNTSLMLVSVSSTLII